MMNRIFLLSLTVAFSIAIRVNAQSAMFGVTQNHSGIYSSDFPSDVILSKKWTVKTEGPIFSSAIVQNGVIYFGSDDSCMFAIDTLGIQKWMFKSNGKIRSTPILKDTIIYFNNYSGRFYALKIHDGEEIWHFDTEGESQFDEWDFYQSSPVFSDTIVYFGSGTNMYALKMKNGEKLWNYPTSGIIHSSPALYNGKLYFGCWNKKLYALDALNGNKLWEFPTGDGIPSSPSVIDSFVFIGSRDANVYAVHANTGQQLWSRSFSGSWMPSSFAMYNDTLFTGSSDAQKFFALNKNNGQVLYSVSLPCYAFSTPAYSNGTVFIGCMNGSLFSIDTKNHKIISCFETDGHIKDVFDALNDDGTLNRSVVADPHYVSMMLSSGSVASTPVIENSVVYFGSSDSCFYAVSDSGGCKLKFQVSNSNIDLGETSVSVIDTSFYVKNISECQDSVEVCITGSPSLFIELIEIQPSRFEILPYDSVNVHIELNTGDLIPDINYHATIVSRSTKNEYNYFNTTFSLKTPVLIDLSQLVEKQLGVIYPNPFNKFINVKTDCDKRVMIINSLGTVVFQEKLKTTDIQIDLSYLQKGIYFMIINTDDKYYTTRIVKSDKL